MTKLAEFFSAIAFKHLTAVDAQPQSSNQHEIGGLVKAGFGPFLGDPGKETLRYTAQFLYISDDSGGLHVDQGAVSWYDSRRAVSSRGPELRLYYQSNSVTERIAEGDLMVIAFRPDNSLQLFFAPAGTASERTIAYLFGLAPDEQRDFEVLDFGESDRSIDSVSSSILQMLQIEPRSEQSLPDYVDLLTAHFPDGFPTTAEFSLFARETAPVMDRINSPDETLLAWMQQEELLFRALERVLVEDKLVDGFDDVDDFISVSLSVQNRRKSRAGQAFEHHVAEILMASALEFERGVSTENKAKPDFLFPDSRSYHDKLFDHDQLLMLGAKTSCKDRWRQVLTEAEKIPAKHLITMETAISEAQTDEMEAHRLTLVVPQPLQFTYTLRQQEWLLSLADFIDLIHNKQSGTNS